MLSFNSGIQRLVSTFLTYRNDVDIYTEDEEKDKEFYKLLLNKLVDRNIRINDVTPLGSKSNVLDACRNELPNGRKKLFIVDGDINLVNEKETLSLPNLYIHNAYCVENLLIEKEGVCKFIYFQCATKSASTIETELAYEDWLEPYTALIVKLFLTFAVLNSFGLPFKLFSAYKYHIVRKNKYEFDKTLLTKDIESLESEALMHISKNDFDNEMSRLSGKWITNLETLLTIVSGKDYLVPILLIKALEFKQSQAKPSQQEFKLLMVQISDLKRFLPLKQTIESL